MKKRILGLVLTIIFCALFGFSACSMAEPVRIGETDTMPVYVEQTQVIQVTVNQTNLDDNVKLGFGDDLDAILSYQTTDSNARALYGWVDKTVDNPNNVPLFIWGDEGLEGTNLTWFAGVTEPNLVVVNTALDEFIAIGHMPGDGPHLHSSGQIGIMPNSDSDDHLTVATIDDIPTLFGTGSYLRIGDAGTTGHSLNSEDDLLLTGDFEIDGTSYFDGIINTYGTVIIRDSSSIAVGGGQDSYMQYSNADANAHFVMFGLPIIAQDADNVPVFAFGDRNMLGVDTGFFDEIVQPNIAVVDADRDNWIRTGFHADDTAGIATSNDGFSVYLNDQLSRRFLITDSNNVNTLFGSGSYTRFGNAGVLNSMSANEDNVLFTGETEFDGTMFIDGNIDAGTGVNVITSSSLDGITLIGENAGSGGRFRFELAKETPVLNNVIGRIDWFANDLDSPRVGKRWAMNDVYITNGDNGTEESTMRWYLMDNGTENNLAMSLSGNGTLTVDAGYGTFDNYDDAELLRQGIKYDDKQVLIDAGVLIENIEYKTIVIGWNEVIKPVGKERILEPEKTILKYKQGENGLESYIKTIPAVTEYYTVNEVVNIVAITEDIPIGTGYMFNVQAMIRLLSGANTQADDKINNLNEIKQLQIEALQYQMNELQETNEWLFMELIKIQGRIHTLENK